MAPADQVMPVCEPSNLALAPAAALPARAVLFSANLLPNATVMADKSTPPCVSGCSCRVSRHDHERARRL
jgi:hypothetical protein